MVKSVDLISGIGGTLGLWLGLSFLSLGTFIIETAGSARSLFSPSSATGPLGSSGGGGRAHMP